MEGNFIACIDVCLIPIIVTFFILVHGIWLSIEAQFLQIIKCLLNKYVYILYCIKMKLINTVFILFILVHHTSQYY
jgi:hypothetical protein